MADVEKKGRGRPKGTTASPSKTEEVKKRPIVTETNGDGPIAKRGRGRPPKKGGAKAKPKVNGRGRGRPPKVVEKKDSQDESESQSEQEEGVEST